MSEEKVEYAKPLPDFRPETKPFGMVLKNTSYYYQNVKKQEKFSFIQEQ